MIENVERFTIQRVSEKSKQDVEDMVTRELPLTILLNNRELITILCSPSELECLVIGFLSSEGLINSKEEIKGIMIDAIRGVARVETKDDKEFTDEQIFRRVITSGCGAGGVFYRVSDTHNLIQVESKVTISGSEVFALVKSFQQHSETYRITGGVHSAALCDNKDILVFAEDIGRHNAIDKVFGKCFLEDISTDDRIVITSGRIPSEILLKVAKRKIPIIVSKSAPTDLGVKLAMDLGITLIGFVRGKRMNVYTNGQRVVA
ncbi:formate dehydrogenase accessory sulfurtransferase FdhD [Chloroflexota bacterium]